MRGFRLLALALFVWPLALAAGEANGERLRQALAAEAHFDSAGALALFLQANAAQPDDPFILEKISKQYSDSISDTSDPGEKKRRAEQAVAYARRAVARAPKSAVNRLALAISYGKLGFCSNTRTEVEYSRLVKGLAEQAIAFDPKYDWAYHVLGRWNYEVASLSAPKRFFAKLIYGGLPPGSTAEAVRLLRQAIKLAPKVPAHHVELGFAFLADNQPNLARMEFEQALRLPLSEKYDIEEKKRAQAALENLARE
jgi:tetratricopeptide (TPR) repeat protein